MLKQALHDLATEAARSIQEKQPVRPAADYAATFDGEINAQTLAQNIARRQSVDPFADAYIRWQFTGFTGAALPDLSDRQFDAFVASLPRLIPNPRAGAELIDTMGAAARAGTLTPAQEQALNTMLDELAAQASKAAAMNTPALGLRAWIMGQLPPASPRRLALLLEQCVALVEAGWPSDDAKTTLTEALDLAQRDRGFTPQQRTVFIDRLRAVLGKKRIFITSTRLRERTLAVEYGDTGIFDFEARKWSRMLMAD